MSEKGIKIRTANQCDEKGRDGQMAPYRRIAIGSP